MALESKRRFLVTGAAGSLGSTLMRVLGDSAIGVDLPELDITDGASVSEMVESVDPEWIINCAAVTDVDLCERDPELAFRVNRDGTALLADTGRRLLTISTDHVFGGGPPRSTPYTESDATSPVNIYGESKLQGEKAAVRRNPDVIIVRTSWLYSDRSGLIPFLWNTLTDKGGVRAVGDQIAALTYVPDLAAAIIELIDQGSGGLYHAVNNSSLTPFDAAVMLSEYTGGEVARVTWTDLGLDAPRPLYSVLASEKGVILPGMENALDRWRRCNA